jgi:putative copper export protein
MAAWFHLGSVGALTTSAYGRTLLVKLALLALVVATGAYNWRRVRPNLVDGCGARRLRRSAWVELAVGAAVLAVTAVLVATPLPMDGLP